MGMFKAMGARMAVFLVALPATVRNMKSGR